jgi:hypothetical protein
MSDESSQVQGRTGEICPQSGPYRASEDAQIIRFIRKGEPFPPGSNGAPTKWVLLKAEAA